MQILLRLLLVLLTLIGLAGKGLSGTWSTNNFLYKPATGARGEAQKNLFDSGLDRIDARLGKEIWVGDPNYGQTLQSSITAIGSVLRILRVPSGTYNIISDLTIPANITLKPERGAVFSIATGTTLTINGPLMAGPYQVFSCTGTGKVTFGAGAVKEVYPEWWGFTDDAAAALNRAIATQRTVRLQAGKTYPVTTSVDIGTTNNVEIIGGPGSVIDGTSSTALVLFYVGGYPGSSAALGADVSQAATSITSALAGSLSAGDIILIRSTDLWIPGGSGTYWKGELCEVLSVAGNTINLKSPLYDSYAAATTTVYEIIAPQVTLGNLTVKRNSNQWGIEVGYARNVRCEGCRVTGARQVGIAFSYILGGTISNNYVTDCWYSGSGLSYGLLFESCQNILEEGNRTFGGRHGIAHGGNEPNRDITLIGNFIDNYHGSGTCALDFHENSEKVRVLGNVIKNGMEYSGIDVAIENNTIDTYTGDSNVGINLYSNKLQNYMLVHNNVITGYGSGVYGIQLKAGHSNITANLVDISGNIINSNCGIYILPYSSTITGYTIDRLVMRNNQVTSVGLSLSLNANGAADITVNDATIDGGTYVSTTYRPVDYLPSATSALVKFQHLTLKGADSGTTCLNVGHPVDVTVEDCHLIATGAAGGHPAFYNTGQLIFRRNRLQNFATSSGLYFSTPATAYVRDNILINCTGAPYFGSTKVMEWKASQGKTVAYGTAAPTSGTWAQGDIVWNTAPGAAGAPGWVCVTGGTPGTWKAMANLAN
jgi:hypothetical protein